jgi:hypothetical protein
MEKDVVSAGPVKTETFTRHDHGAPSTQSTTRVHKTGDSALTARGNLASEQPSSAPQTFEFVLVTDAGSRRQVRRHAMRQYMRQRRLDGIARLGSSRVPLPRWSPQTTSVSSDDSSSRVEELDGDCEQNSNVSTGSDNSSAATQRTFQTTEKRNVPRRDVDRTSSDPLAFPGVGGMVDPFSSYPTTVSQGERKLINHCKYSLSPLI